ncbi:HepT-like ribonuclease domain-containing protein [Mesorhizobium sp. M0276]|uniref:HepT-like ribonuclease domain-containing protein n=1 Tax=Mesorhizobium sp. M0276 TaxID=2956928 RepID=UPI00333880BB
MNEFELAEDAILDQHEPSWIAQGYKLVRRPSRGSLPSFLERYLPDAVLLGRTPQVVVEVLRKGQPHVERKVRELNALLAKHDDWRLEVLYAGEEPDQLPSVSTELLKQSLSSTGRLAPIDPRGGLLLLWATLEALSRRLEPGKTMRPQTPGRIVELLAGAGFVAPSEAEQLREAVQWRNRLVHGDLTISPSETQVLKLVEIVGDLIGTLERREAIPSA